MDAEAKTRVTFEEYMALPETMERVELIDGQIVRETVSDIPAYTHQETLEKLYRTLNHLPHPTNLYLAPIGLRFDDGAISEPDLFWVSAENDQSLLDEKGCYWHGAPDLVVEIISPSTGATDRGDKFDLYQKYGVREYWLVEPEAKFTEVYRHNGNKFERQGVLKAGQSFVSAALNGATIETKSWFGE